MLTRHSFKVRSGWKGPFWRKAAVPRHVGFWRQSRPPGRPPGLLSL